MKDVETRKYKELKNYWYENHTKEMPPVVAEWMMDCVYSTGTVNEAFNEAAFKCIADSYC